MILICAKEDDSHALRVAGILQGKHGRQVFIFDMSKVPGTISLTGRLGNGAGDLLQLGQGDRSIRLDEVTSFWWRRPQPLEIDWRIEDPAARHFAYQECVSALYGMLECCSSLWVNDPHNDTAAEYKPYQLKVAHECGFRVPDTLFTTDPATVVEFRNYHGGMVIYKAFNQRGLAWRPTRILRDEDMAMLGNLRHAPVIFQPVVPGIRDVRVTVIGEQVIASEFDIENMEGVDYRVRMAEIPCRPHELPNSVIDQVLAFMARLGLEYGGIDFRLTPDRDYVFFEINTAGEFLYVEDRTGQPIAEAMAAHLAAGQPSHPGRAHR